MEWGTLKIFDCRWILALGLVLGSSVPASYAGRVVDPDQAPAISRFGEFTDRNGRLVRKHEQLRPDEEEFRNAPAPSEKAERAPASQFSDSISTHAAARMSPQSSESKPLGTVRRNGVQEIAVIAGDLGFFPRTVFVTQDIPVRLFVTGASKNALCIMMDSFNVRKQIRSQTIEEVSFTPDRPGKFRFYCPVNGAEGFIVVREFGRGEES
ncbi:MAG: cupredoxin domain-containing protein [Bdellovibrionales bacterium]|nr:cupredoxin domain-containing protein [Bdellovibrionales bacterium]